MTGTSSGDDDGDVEDVSGSGSTRTSGSTSGGAPRSDLDEIASNFDDEALENINDCWQDKLKDLEDALEYYEETNATWETNQGQSSINPEWGAQTQFEVDPAKVVFYPNQIVKWIKKNQPTKKYPYRKDIKFEHISMLVTLHEYVHTIQAKHEAADDDGRAYPSPYEWLNMEIEAYRLSYEWFKKIFRATPPLIKVYEDSHSAHWKDGKYVGTYKRKVKEYQKLEQKIANGETLSEVEEKEKEKLETYFQKVIDDIYVELTLINGSYNKDRVDLRCDE